MGTLLYFRTHDVRCAGFARESSAKNKLKLNDDTTELVVMSSKHQSRPGIASIRVGEEIINHVPTVRNLGVLLDH